MSPSQALQEANIRPIIWGRDVPIPPTLAGLCSCLGCRCLAVHERSSGLFGDVFLNIDVHRRSAIRDTLGPMALWTVGISTEAGGDHACS